MSNDDLLYQTGKLIYTIIFNFYENDYRDDINMFDLVIVESLKNIIEYLTSQNFLSTEVKNNISNYLMQAREIQDNDRKRRVELINEIVGLMNSQKKDESLLFYRLELHKRRKDLGYIISTRSDLEVKNEIENVHDSILNDHYVLVSHSYQVSDKEFEEEYLEWFTDTNIYYESINSILYEYPQIFKNEIFYNRMMKVLNINNQLHKDNKAILKTNKRLLKKIDRKIK